MSVRSAGTGAGAGVGAGVGVAEANKKAFSGFPFSLISSVSSSCSCFVFPAPSSNPSMLSCADKRQAAFTQERWGSRSFFLSSAAFVLSCECVCVWDRIASVLPVEDKGDAVGSRSSRRQETGRREAQMPEDQSMICDLPCLEESCRKSCCTMSLQTEDLKE